MPDKVTADEVRAALSVYLDECARLGTEPVAETYTWYQLMRERLRMDFSGLNHWSRETAEKKFNSQVLTQLNNLVKSGRLVKRHVYQNTVFYTPAKAAALDRAVTAREQAAEQERQRALTIRLRLDALGVFPLTGHGNITLSLDDWHKLVTLAENGTALRREG
jgi:hypothetical protein